MLVTSSTAQILKPNAIALGNFDGVHLGHRRVVQPIFHDKSLHATVVSFNPHPREFFTGQSKKLLTPLDEKIEQLELLNVEQLVLLPFDREIASLSPQQFVEQILLQQLRASLICVGEDFRFGKERTGSAADLQAIAAKFGVEVIVTPLQLCSGTGSKEELIRISSSSIRQALERGEVDIARQMLGRPYSLTGTVVSGQRLGRTIGFPTANLKLPANKFLPGRGVYSVRVFIEREPISKPGVMNIGIRPTLNGTDVSVEVHLLDWTGDLYGKTSTVNLERFLRPEQKFSSLEALKAQIVADCQAARQRVNFEI